MTTLLALTAAAIAFFLGWSIRSLRARTAEISAAQRLLEESKAGAAAEATAAQVPALTIKLDRATED
jgi:hypothetical protein